MYTLIQLVAENFTLVNHLLYMHMYMHACSVAQLCPTLCNPIDCSLPGSSVQGLLQARILE